MPVQIRDQIFSSNSGGIGVQVRVDLASHLAARAAEAQSVPNRGRYRLLIGLGVALGVLYVVFLGVWYWATRVRPRAIDTNRRIL
jgi:hypothetical protein